LCSKENEVAAPSRKIAEVGGLVEEGGKEAGAQAERPGFLSDAGREGKRDFAAARGGHGWSWFKQACVREGWESQVRKWAMLTRRFPSSLLPPVLPAPAEEKDEGLWVSACIICRWF